MNRTARRAICDVHFCWSSAAHDGAAYVIGVTDLDDCISPHFHGECGRIREVKTQEGNV